MQGSQQPGSGLAVGAARRPLRQHHRHEIHKLLYVNIDHANGGIIRNLSECGAGLQSVTPLRQGEEVHLRFDLLQPRVHVETGGRVCWASATGQAGVVFSPLPAKSHRSLQDWLLVQLLARAEQLFGKESVFATPSKSVPGLTLSGEARDPFSLLIEPSYREDSLGAKIRQSPRLLAAIVDALVLAIAILLFAVIALSFAHSVPVWPVSAAVIAAAVVAFAGLYWYLSTFWMGTTPGNNLVQSALGEEELDSQGAGEARTRFR